MKEVYQIPLKFVKVYNLWYFIQMKFLKNNIPLIVFFFIANVIFIAANIPFIERVRNIPDNAVPTFQHQMVTMDYLVYIAAIREGRDGAWMTPTLYNTDPSAKTAIFLYFTVLGKVAAVTGLNPVAIYHLARLAEYEIFIYVLYGLILKIVGKKVALWVGLIAILASPPAAFLGYIWYGKEALGIPAWWMLNPFRRSDMLPHHLASAILMLLEIQYFMKSIKTGKSSDTLKAAIFAFFSAVFHPISAILVILGQPLTLGFHYLYRSLRDKKLGRINIFPVLLPAIFSAVAIFSMRYHIESSFPYSIALRFDIDWYARYKNYIRDFWIGGGPLFLFSIPMIIKIIIKPDDMNWTFLAIWALTPYVLIPFDTTIGVSRFRFALLLSYVPLGMIYYKTINDLINGINLRFLRLSIFTVIVFIFAGTTVPSLVIFYRDYRNLNSVIEQGMYVRKDTLAAIDYLGKHAEKYSFIMTDEINGALIPAYIPMVTYIGNYYMTWPYEEKKAQSNAFFEGAMTDEQAQTLIRGNSIKYIFSVSEETQEWNIGSYKIPLNKWYSNNTVTIYKIE
jgi:hypothetical protein